MVVPYDIVSGNSNRIGLRRTWEVYDAIFSAIVDKAVMLILLQTPKIGAFFVCTHDFVSINAVRPGAVIDSDSGDGKTCIIFPVVYEIDVLI